MDIQSNRALALRTRARGQLQDIAFDPKKKRYYSKAYRAYVRRLLDKHTGKPAGLGEVFSASLFEASQRIGFMRRILDSVAMEKAKAEHNANEQVRIGVPLQQNYYLTLAMYATIIRY